MQEEACETINNCDTDQLSFKAYFSAWLASTTTLAPFTQPTISPWLSATARAVASICTAGGSGAGAPCGFKWTDAPKTDGSLGVGQQMSALGAIQSAMVQIPGQKIVAPVTTSTGGTSKGDASAGQNSANATEAALLDQAPVATRDRVAAGILTFALGISVVGGSAFMVLEG
jgi:mannan endo-1,6-alpha-mannosidase